jgi:hypothetical protein
LRGKALRKTYLSSFAKLGFGLTLGCAAVAANASLTFFTSQGAFQTALTGGGSSQVGFEDWETARIDNSVAAMDDPANAATNNAFFLPGEIDPLLTVQSNLNGTNSAVTNPRGVGGLAVANDFGGYPTSWVCSNFFSDATDMLFTGGLVGVGGNLLSPGFGSSTFRIDVYDNANVFQGTTNVVVSNTSGFWGVISTSEIGRINMFSVGGDVEGMDNVEMWAAPVPEPATMAALGLGAIALLRRRSKK